MDSLYIDRKGSVLEVQAGRLVIRIPDATRPTTLPLRQLTFIAVSASVTLNSSLLLALDEAEVTLVIIHPRQHGRWVICNGSKHGNIARRMRQYQWLNDPELSLMTARRMVAAKLLAHYRALGRHRRRRPDLRTSLSRGMKHIKERWQALPAANTLDQLRGLEGAGAAAYFAAFQALFADSWQFAGRKRRPPPDPVNALLSLTYTLLHAEAVRALVANGLDPALGCLHETAYNRESLACDLVELLRASADSWVQWLIRKEILRHHHFSSPAPGQVLLNKEGRAIFYAQFQARALGWRARCRRIAGTWATELET